MINKDSAQNNKRPNQTVTDAANPTKLYIEPTTSCNLQCKTCVRNTWDDEDCGHMPKDVFAKLLKDIQQFPSLEKVAFWGIGEPLTNPRIAEMISEIKKLNLHTELITNAMLLTADTAENLIDAGLDRLIVSVDSTSPKQLADIRTGATLNEIIKNVQQLNHIRRFKHKANPEIGIEFTLMKSNLTELKNLKELGQTMGASSIIVTNILPYSEEHKDEILYQNAATNLHDKPRSSSNPEIFLPRVDMNPEYANDLGKISYEALTLGPKPAINKEYKGICPFIERGSIVVGRTGDSSPCIPLLHSYTCYVLGRKKKIVKHVIGNIITENLKDIWHKPDYCNFRRKVADFSFSPCVECGGCDLRDSNQEDCFGNTHPTCGDCLWAKGVIQCP